MIQIKEITRSIAGKVYDIKLRMRLANGNVDVEIKEDGVVMTQARFDAVNAATKPNDPQAFTDWHVQVGLKSSLAQILRI